MEQTDRLGAIPFAQFRTHDGRVLALSREDYDLAAATARICRCGTCDCCRALEYVTEAMHGSELP
jgi:hypothetical protein